MTPVAISVEEYLRSSFDDGDREFVDGLIEERYLGEKGHSKAQKRLILFFAPFEDRGEWFAFPEQRIQVAPTRFRVPDVCVYADEEPEGPVFRMPPFLCIEILSPEDRIARLTEKIDDYFAFGVRFVWVVDPDRQRGWIHTPGRAEEAHDGLLRTSDPEILCPLARLW